MSQIIHFAKRALANEAYKVVHGYIDEIYASVLGFKTKASLGRPIDKAFEEIEVLFADKELAVQRAHSLLGKSIEHAEAVVNVLLTVLSSDSIPSELSCRVHMSPDDYLSTNRFEIEGWLINNESVSAVMAETNAWGFDCDEISFEEFNKDDNEIHFVAYLSGEQDQDRPYCGTKVVVEGSISVGKYRNISDDFSTMTIVPYIEDLRDYEN